MFRKHHLHLHIIFIYEKNIVINKKIISLFEKKNVTIFESEEGDFHEKILEVWLMESAQKEDDK